MQSFRFKKFKVYQDAILFRMRVKKLSVKYFPSDEKYQLTDQVLRAANSIVLNIAEGADRSTDKDFALFLNRSHTSLCEVVACLDIAKIEKYVSDSVYSSYFVEAQVLADQITAFRRKLLNDSYNKKSSS
jgi:four helix bundle protein